MNEFREERRLTTILAADVVGYSRIMSVDESGTLAQLKAIQKELIEPKTSEHGGRIVKLIGDGILMEFTSVVGAVRFAMEIQRALANRNRGIPEDRRITYRIGINIGDIIVDGDDIYGDGVNVAARLEGLAEPGGICVSSSVREQVHHKLELEYEDLGQQNVKNIVQSAHVFRIGTNSSQEVATGPEQPAARRSEKPSIAVLPFENMSADTEQDYLADGISEDLITTLSKIRWFLVIARNSTFTYKGQAVDVTQVARELNVRYVLEGSVRKAGARVRISAQLIDATTGHHVWAERYDRQLEDIFELQDEMTQTIVGALEPELGAAERARIASKPTENLDAWETYQRALGYMWSWQKENNLKAVECFRQATEKDPGFAPAHAYEAYSHYMSVVMGWAEDQPQRLADGMTAAKKALACDDKDSVAYFGAARIHMMRGEHDASIAALEKAIELNPSFAQAYHGLGMVWTLSGKLEEAKSVLEKATRLSPRDPLHWAFTIVHALACVISGDYEEGVYWGRKTLQNPKASGYWPHSVLAAALAHLDQMEEARSEVRKALEAKPDLSLSYLTDTYPTKDANGLDPWLTGLGKAGLPA